MYSTLPLLIGTLLFPIRSFANFHDHKIHLRHHHEYSLARRQAPPVLPGNWTLQGCYTDNGGARTLTGSSFVSTTNMSWEACTAFCDQGSFVYAGVEYSQECYCGNVISNGGANATFTDCNMACTGSSSEMCGGPNRLDFFWNGKTPPPPPQTLSSYGLWQAMGCFNDSVNARTLSVPMGVTGPMTVQLCADACYNHGYSLAGLEYADECYCDTKFENFGTFASSGCTMTCAGNSSEICGGPNRLTVYNYNGTVPPPQAPPPGGGGSTPITLPSYGQWQSLGCYNDSVNARTLSIGMGVTGPMTVQLCADACFNHGYPLAGVEYAAECYCDVKFENFGAPAASGCSMACAGNSSEFCGGPNRLNVYNFTGTLTTPPTPPGGGGPPPNGPAPTPVLKGLPGTWNYSGCYVDNAHGRILSLEIPDNNNMTVETCVGLCSAQNFTVAGLEYSVQCFCGNEIINGGVLASNQATCNMGCSGNSSEACGAGNLLSIYSTSPNITLLPVPVPQNSSLPGSWQYQGCLAEPGAARVFPYQIIFPTTNDAQTCLSLCSEYGYPAAGMEYGDECWCGDVADIAANGGKPAPEADCSMACSGDPIHLCGGPQRLQLYEWVGPPLNVWNTPAVTGHYEFLIGGLTVPLLATLGKNNKVAFLQKWGTGPPNSTGAYELDLSLTHRSDLAWRAMHVQTDVFCSGSLILPDKAARQINVGGWSLDSTYGIRLYIPDGSPGVNGTNDWQENYDELSLQNGRWYPGTMIMSNGSILVMGGEGGSNGVPVPTLEILPKPPGGTVVSLDFLLRTDPNNLYPFLFVLPGGGIFVIYYNEARILDPVTFATTKTFPILPGAVTGGGGGRTYPLEGTAMILPQHAPYTDPAVILVCGGSTPGPGLALDNCVSIAPESQNATWTIERMPYKRVMTCMTALPDGTFMILCGAQQGVAGFGLASDPINTALLYDPSKPVNQRISILNTTIVARLYHSEAVLLQDGRILVSGSDPNPTIPVGGPFPEEYRVEVYVPPYLANGQVQPTYNISQTDWAYGGQYQITNVNLPAGGPAKISLLGAVSSTHGNSMGQRTIFPAFSCSGTTCTITAPPNNKVCPPGWFQLFLLDGPTPSWSQWVRIGGDPAQLGNWPNLPDFTTPGV